MEKSYSEISSVTEVVISKSMLYLSHLANTLFASAITFSVSIKSYAVDLSALTSSNARSASAEGSGLSQTQSYQFPDPPPPHCKHLPLITFHSRITMQSQTILCTATASNLFMLEAHNFVTQWRGILENSGIPGTVYLTLVIPAQAGIQRPATSSLGDGVFYRTGFPPSRE